MQIQNPAVAVSSLNMTDIGGNTVLTGQGPPGVGVLRVAPAGNETGDSVAAGSSSAIGSTNIFTSASNLNGCILKAGSVLAISSSSTNAGVVVDTVAPAHSYDGEPVLLAAGTNVACVLPVDVYIPAGQALYVYNAVAQPIYYSLRYKLL